MITIYRLFISIHFIKTVTTAFTWNQTLNSGVSDDTKLDSWPYHDANKFFIFCFLSFCVLLNICCIGYSLLAFIHSHTIVFFYISRIFICRSLCVTWLTLVFVILLRLELE